MAARMLLDANLKLAPEFVPELVNVAVSATGPLFANNLMQTEEFNATPGWYNVSWYLNVASGDTLNPAEVIQAFMQPVGGSPASDAISCVAVSSLTKSHWQRSLLWQLLGTCAVSGCVYSSVRTV